MKVRVGDYITDYGDGIHGTPTYDDSGQYYFINGNNREDGLIQITPETPKVTAEEYERINRPLSLNTVLLSINGTLGKVALYNNEPVALGKSACYINVKSDIDRRFIKYVFSTDAFQNYIYRVAHGSTIKNLAPSQVAEYEFEKPALSPSEIANILSSLDDKIANNKKLMAELESTARLIYDYWFNQFDFPDENGNPYRSSGGAVVHNETLHCEIPESWETTRLGDVCETRLGGTPDTTVEAYWGGGIPWLNSAEVATSPILESEKTITEIGQNESATSFAPSGSVLLSITRYIRPSILAMDACFNQSVIAILKNDNLGLEYLFPFIQSQVPRYLGLRTGAQQPHINKATVDVTPIIIPPSNVLIAYNELAAPLYQQIVATAKQSKELEELRDWLLPMLMNGQVTVRSRQMDEDEKNAQE